MTELTQERLKELLHYDAGTGIFTWIKTRGRVRIGRESGSIQPNGYRYIMVDGYLKLSHRLAWLYVTGVFPIDFIDHIDGNKLNNAYANLRTCTNSQNKMNCELQINNTSGFKGVTWCKSNKKWKAQAQIKGKNNNLGLFEFIEEARDAYINFAKINHGKFYKEMT